MKSILISNIFLILFYCSFANSQTDSVLVDGSNIEKKIEKLIQLKVRELEKSEIVKKRYTLEEISAQLNTIRNQKNYNQDSHNMTYAEWAGVILTAVATLVAVLGVGIAMLSFWGYREIMKRTEVVAQENVKTILPSVAVGTISNMAENGEFSSIIEDAVDRVVYKDLVSDEGDEK